MTFKTDEVQPIAYDSQFRSSLVVSWLKCHLILAKSGTATAISDPAEIVATPLP